MSTTREVGVSVEIMISVFFPAMLAEKRNLVAVGVQYIFNSVVEQLLLDPRRRFSYAGAHLPSQFKSAKAI